jgi:hypothetical protein
MPNNLFLCIFIFIFLIFSIINLQNKFFTDYILETKNYFLLFLPLRHKYIYKNNEIVGFISKLVDYIIIAVYITPKYRNQKLIKQYFQSNTPIKKYIITNNNEIINYLHKHNYKNLINIPYFKLYCKY